jgi:hypothetical protein
MAHPGQRGRPLRALAVPLALSGGVHGLLLVALWLWPAPPERPASPALDTRVSLELCVLDPVAPAPGRPGERADGGEVVSIEPVLRPVLMEAPLPAPEGEPWPGAAGPSGEGGPAAAGAPSGLPGGGLFPLAASAASVVYVLDRSMSMGPDGALEVACRELLASLRRLPASARFQVIAYNLAAEPLPINGRVDLVPAEPPVIEQAARALGDLDARGGTNHARALFRGLTLHPAVLYLITDADDLPPEDVQHLTRFNHDRPSPTAIHAVELTRRRNPPPDGPLARLAHANGGTYRRVPVE